MIFVQFNTVLLEGNVAVVVVAVANMTKVLLGSLVTGGTEMLECFEQGQVGPTKKNKFSRSGLKLDSDGKPRNGFITRPRILEGQFR